MKSGCPEHPKFKRLAKLLGSPPTYHVAGILECLWYMTANFADDGNISKVGVDSFEAWMGWGGEAGELWSTLIASGFLNDDGTVHDWYDHCPKYVHDRRSKRAKRGTLSQTVGECRNLSPNVADATRITANVVAYPTQPNPTESNPTQPNQIKPPPAAAVRLSAKEGKPRKPIILNTEHLAIYQAYPRHVARAPAMKAIENALQRIAGGPSPPDDPAAFLRERVAKYAACVRGKVEEKFIPHPATWFNRESYHDDMLLPGFVPSAEAGKATPGKLVAKEGKYDRFNRS